MDSDPVLGTTPDSRNKMVMEAQGVTQRWAHCGTGHGEKCETGTSGIGPVAVGDNYLGCLLPRT